MPESSETSVSQNVSNKAACCLATSLLIWRKAAAPATLRNIAFDSLCNMSAKLGRHVVVVCVCVLAHACFPDMQQGWRCWQGWGARSERQDRSVTSLRRIHRVFVKLFTLINCSLFVEVLLWCSGLPFESSQRKKGEGGSNSVITSGSSTIFQSNNWSIYGFICFKVKVWLFPGPHELLGVFWTDPKLFFLLLALFLYFLHISSLPALDFFTLFLFLCSFIFVLQLGERTNCRYP